MRSNKLSSKPRQQIPRPVEGKKVFSYQTVTPTKGRPGGNNYSHGARIKRFIKHLPMWLAGLTIVACIGFLLTLNSNVNVVSLNTSDNPLLREKSVYEETAKKLLANSITAKTKLTFAGDKFEQAMKKKFPELATVKVTLPLMGHRPILKIGSNRPVVVLENDQGQLFVIDRQGRALMKLTSIEQSKQMNLLLLKDQSTTPVALGLPVITEEDAGFIAEVIAQFDDKDIKITELTLPAVAHELHAKIEGKSYVVKFNTNTDARQSAGAYLAVKQKLEKENINPAEYIDLRVEEKTYYK